MKTKSVSKQDAEIYRIMEMIEYIEKHEPVEEMKWHIIPNVENDEYYIMIITSPRLPKELYCGASLWKKCIHGNKDRFKSEIDFALLAIKDRFDHPDQD